jgi:hypothetical protein
MLSDLIDVRRGEIPHPDGTALARFGMRATVEAHLAACESCHEDLRTLEEVGAAFAEFAVGEPPARHFDDYARIVRARLGRSGVAVAAVPAAVPGKRHRNVVWAMFGASALAAASLFLVLSRALPLGGNTNLKVASEGPAANTSSVPRSWALPPARIQATPLRVLVPNGPQLQPSVLDVDVEPAQPEPLKQLLRTEGESGFLVVGERTFGDERPLLGAFLKTTRDEDRDADKKLGLMVYDVIPGSPAHRMGLMRGDCIVTANGMAVDNGGVEEAVKFFTRVKQAGAGEPISLQMVRPKGGQHVFMVREGVLGDYGP